ncbi:MAG: hypothetical protein KGL53_08840, partial [Elusimicrobia bacterium]|nr:hypothetical protein [Elusimicrobiota bacterium]
MAAEEEEGVLVSRGSFRVDREAALKKLAAFQLPIEELLVPWARCAEAAGARRLDVALNPFRLRVLMDGTPFAPEDLADPYYSLFSEEDAPRAVSYLAEALLAVSRLGPKRLRAASGDGKTWSAFEGRDLQGMTAAAPGL